MRALILAALLLSVACAKAPAPGGGLFHSGMSEDNVCGHYVDQDHLHTTRCYYDDAGACPCWPDAGRTYIDKNGLGTFSSHRFEEAGYAIAEFYDAGSSGTVSISSGFTGGVDFSYSNIVINQCHWLSPRMEWSDTGDRVELDICVCVADGKAIPCGPFIERQCADYRKRKAKCDER